MIKPLHRSLNQLAETPISSTLKASTFASCSGMEDRLDAVFSETWADAFHALPLSRKQVICAVLSGQFQIPKRPTVLRSNLCLGAERYLLYLRFGGYDTRMHRFIEGITPSCLRRDQYDPLWVLASQSKTGLDQIKDFGLQDAAGIIDQLYMSTN